MDIKKPVAALFDLDGVILDTESQYDIFWAEQGRRYLPHIENFHKLVKGQTIKQMFDNYFVGMDEAQKQIRIDIDIFEENMSYEFIPGVEAFISGLKDNNVRIAIVTSSNNLKMTSVYSAHPELKEWFSTIITANRITHSKPDPECFQVAAADLGVDPDNCFVFEDSFHGLQAGNAAGMTVIGLATTNSREAITDKAHHIIDNFNDFTFEKLIQVSK